MAVDNPSYFTVSSNGNQVHQRPTKLSLGSSSDCTSPRSLSRDAEFFSRSSIDSPCSEPPLYSDVLSKNHYLIPTAKSGRDQSTKRSFTSLLRSLSANAACNQDPQSILLGEPRPSDIAPADHCSPFVGRSNRRFTHSRNASENRHAGRRRVLHSESDEVFHTMPLSANTRRRHSIGAYLTKDRGSSKNLLKVTSVPSEMPREPAPKVPNDGSPVVASRNISLKKIHPVTTLHCDDSPVIVNSVTSNGSSQRKKRMRCPSMKEMENIIIVSSKESPEAGLWVDYLVSCFNKMMSDKARQHYKIITTHVEELIDQIPDNVQVKQLSKAKLQILILCPKLLHYVENLPIDGLTALTELQEDKVLAMLLGVNDGMINDDHKRAFPTYEYWQRMIMKDQDTTFVDKFLSTAVDILSKKFRNGSENANFSIIPKKIKPGQNRVIALLNEPLTNQDVITVHVEKKGELLQIKSFKRRNPYTLQFDVPDCCLEVSMLIWIKIEKNGIPCGSRQIKCESRLRELDQILRGSDNPLEFMCQTLGFKTTDRDQLDSWMLTAFQKNIPPHFNLLSSPLQAEQHHLKVNTSSVDEYPTLLHFAARFGLERLCWQLLECPGGEIACDTQNVRHLKPADLAQAHGFPEIATLLRSFMKMSEFSNMYYYLKNMSEDNPEASTSHVKKKDLEIQKKLNKTKVAELATPDTDKSDPFSDDCLHKLELKDSVNEEVKVVKPPTPIPELLYENDFCHNGFDTSIQRALENDYLIQPSNKKVECSPIKMNRPKQIDLNPINRNIVPEISSPDKSKLFSPSREFYDLKNSIALRSNMNTPMSNQDNLSITTPTGQDELAEIIKDFKNNVFTITEVEKLVLDWRNRNETQQSLKEKQEQLNKMREEYDKLQKRIKEDMKRPTPFERVRKMFSKGKSKNKNGNSESASSQRPNSGLSVHSVSSSSSGRLSTASGASLGESGTQSDNEDIRMFTKITGMQDCHKPSNDNHDFDNYLIPPPPRPIVLNLHDGKHTQPCSSHMKDIRSPHHMDTINEREVFPSFKEINQDININIIKTQFGMPNNVVEHNYINMSPA